MTNSQPDIFLPYWRNEITGDLAEAIKRYFLFSVGEDLIPLTEKELKLVTYYIYIWLEYPWLNLEPHLGILRRDIKSVKTYEDLNHLITKAQIVGIDPF